MKVFISLDMEGISGLSEWEDVIPGRRHYEAGRRLLTQDVNAAIEGALEAGATQIIVNESHGPMNNIILEELHPQADVIRGFFKPLCMMQGIDSSCDAAFFIGYHGKAGTGDAVLNHTLSGLAIHRLILNGKEVGEAGLNAAIAGAFGVPVVLVTGDSQTSKEVEEDIPGVFTVAVKTGITGLSSQAMHPVRARELIRQQAKEALLHRSTVKPLEQRVENTIEVEFTKSQFATAVSWMPGIELIEGRTVRFHSPDLVSMMPVLQAMLLVTGQVNRMITG
ncbi:MULTISPECIES: M55 family metallopeptidase [Brevibacillus]|uniref:Aminopeptidase n=1 Tax=Brevibacillus porteri TaxID=2126350 RepID=A0ABX5FUU8_9BACL|nr:MULTISPECIES: M55 family metallopeptidase [Brevibacillus]ATF13377.1 aminopeptidase [Brevibacillus brevis X23]MDC0759461.1 M55 family metallopeptidase [Brevibacillus sp. AG]MED1799188.1 M55 family metallopeptidase [Brevibacillus porteri]MED2132424.1 M55 family metallopeptidase [Brevibacillus porteri]MED2744507.1 M55 family metallopeptidase [Brevibacillus porteri]